MQPGRARVLEETDVEARPFLKWAGGKQQLLAKYEPYIPEKIQKYIEPFVGGGAVFFHLWNTGRLVGKVTLFDTNEELMNTYEVVRDRVEELIDAVRDHKVRHSKNYFYEVRNLDRDGRKLTPLERAARTIYLNKTCYNGLFRVNQKGQFNVPIGSYRDPPIVQAGLLRAASRALRGVRLKSTDFRELLKVAQPGDFVYLDPPYDPLSRTANFTSYTAANFGVRDQVDLAEVFRELTSRKCLCMLSNSDTELVRRLYEGFTRYVFRANRAINSNPKGRSSMAEVLVINY